MHVTPVHITMVKKRLANGEPCEKCAQTEEMLRRRGLWDAIDEVVWAIEGDPESQGNRLGARHGVRVAPFFVLRAADGGEQVVTSPLRLIRDHLHGRAGAERAGPDGAPATHPTPGGGRHVADRAAAPRPADGGAPAPVDAAALARRLAGAPPEEIVRFALERWGERCPIAFGGAEEIVLIDMATRLGLPFRVFTLDTGRLHAETHAFLDDVRRRYGIAIELVLPDAAAVADWVRRRGANGFYRDGHRECCAIRKVAPLARALAGCEAWMTGRRRDQSPATRGHVEVVAADPRHAGTSGPVLTVSPLAHWSHDRIWDYIRRHDVPVNPLHERGYASIGCEPCTRPVGDDQPPRAGGWWWEAEGTRESGMHAGGDGI